ncbi:MAG: M4 family metallopeptidase [Saprospirales bacterium]|nr:M4 family metallopeptidase [Saprospirales bacterium]
MYRPRRFQDRRGCGAPADYHRRLPAQYAIPQQQHAFTTQTCERTIFRYAGQRRRAHQLRHSQPRLLRVCQQTGGWARKSGKVYYKALRDYLVKSSQFIDCRLAVIQAATDLYGATVADAAAQAFSTVGIGQGQGGNYLGELAANPGHDLIACTTNDRQNLDLYNGSGQFVARLYDEGVASRPSVSDKGHQIVFINTAGHIVGIDLIYNGAQLENFYATELSFFPDWRGAAISKDGRFLAALSKFEDNRIEVIDLADPVLTSEVFFLYNPTYTTGQITGEVRYADVLEFDYSGEYLMYDAYNELNNGQGEDLSYWDIGFLRFWENGEFVNGGNPFISKLFSGLPDRYSVANPTFAKNAPFVIAFDLFNTAEGFYDVLGANTETGEWDYLIFDNAELGWPSYTRLDDAIMFQHTFGNGRNLFVRPIDPNRITGVGTSANLIVSDHDLGVWHANGTRSLLVDTDEPAGGRLQLQAAPNPATDRLQLSFEAPAAGPVQALVSDLMGRTVQAREWPALPEGPNQLEIDLQALPAGVYVLRVQAGAASAALRVVKQ